MTAQEMLTADGLRSFAIFAEHLNFTHAAEALHITQPSLHAKIGKTGVLDYMFERYLTDAEPKGISFIDWVKSDAYDPAGMKASFRAGWWGSLLTEKILRRE